MVSGLRAEKAYPFVIHSGWCSLTYLDDVTFAVFTLSPPDRTQCVWRGDAHRGWNSRNDCLDLVGLLMQTQVKAPGGPHRDHSVVPGLGWSFQGLWFLARREHQPFPELCVSICRMGMLKSSFSSGLHSTLGGKA